MNSNIEKINNAKELIDKAILKYKKAIDEIESGNQNEEVKKIISSIENEVNKLKKMRMSLENINLSNVENESKK